MLNKESIDLMQCTLDDLQEALVEERITIEQFIEVLVDNFGAKQAKKIVKHNIRLAMKQERKRKYDNKRTL